MARRVKIAVPAGITINNVPGATVADWNVEGGELSVSFLDPVEQSARFSVQGEVHLPRDGAISIPLLRLLETEREGGGVAVDVLGAGELTEARPRGLERTEGAALGPMIESRQSPSLLAFRLSAGAVQRSLDVKVARYTQQAVVTALAEEARYRVLVTPDGKALVEARYFVRNNQRNFARIHLPEGASLWSTVVAGRALKPGRETDGSLLLPLVRERVADGAAFLIEVLYLAKAAAWETHGSGAVPLPALDLPVSRTAIELYHSPMYRVNAEPGAFHVAPFEKPAWPETSSSTNSVITTNTSSLAAATQALVDRFRGSATVRPVLDATPLHAEFPAGGASLFLMAELTREGIAPVLQMTWQRDRKGGN
jgi:hypothetical protein